jgi:uncharacterized membrane protein YraQ (UPF0718 family)
MSVLGHTGETTRRPALWLAGVAAFVAAWFLVYGQLAPFSEWAVRHLPLAPGSHAHEAVTFFLFDTPKVLMLLVLVVFGMGVIRSFFSPEQTRALLAGKAEGVGDVAAAVLGIFTPFCSCSAVPLFVGFVSAGVPLGVTFSFLVAAPMVNEVALALLFGMFGFKVAALYLALGLGVAIAAGIVIGKLGMERYLEDWVRAIQATASTGLAAERPTWPARIASAVDQVRSIVGKVWPYILVGIALGAGIHGYVPEDFLVGIMGKDAPWWSVPAAVLIGVPMYTNAAGIIPIVEALIGKGAALGTVLAFMMSVIALSLPEMIILRKVLKLPLIATFAGVVAAGILLVGYVFNAVL